MLTDKTLLKAVASAAPKIPKSNVKVQHRHKMHRRKILLFKANGQEYLYPRKFLSIHVKIYFCLSNLLIPQRVNNFHLRRLIRRIVSEEHAGQHGEEQRQQYRCRGRVYFHNNVAGVLRIHILYDKSCHLSKQGTDADTD